MARTRRRPNRSNGSQTAARAAAAVAGAFGRWLAFTFASDTQRTFYKAPHVLMNWLVGAGLVAATVLWTAQWQVWAIAAAVGVVYTVGRAGRHLPARRKWFDRAYEALRRDCGFPTSTRANPVNPRTYIAVRQWRGPGIPASGSVTYQPDAAAGTVRNRSRVETVFEQVATTPKGRAWVFDHDAAPAAFLFNLVDDDDPRVARRATRSWVDKTMVRLIGAGSNDPDLSVVIDWDDSAERPDVPATMVVEYGGGHAPDRYTVEADIDTSIDRGVEWLYQWQAGQVTITGVPRDSDPAVQKRMSREIGGMVRAQLPASYRRHATVTVDEWTDNTPAAMTIIIENADYTSPKARRDTEFAITSTMVNRWPDRTWLPEWQHLAASVLTMTAVPRTSVQGLRRDELARFTTTMSRIMTVRGGVAPDLTVHKWRDVTDNDSGQVVESKPAELTIALGSWQGDSNQQIKAEELFDGLSSKTGFGYDWDFDHDQLHMTEYPALPKSIFFPDVGSAEFTRQAELARTGTIVLGPAKGGTYSALKLNSVPHTLCGGNTGSGKSVALTIPLFWALWFPTDYELLVCDPKRTDFTWTREFPNVRFAARKEDIATLVAHARKRLDEKVDILSKYGVKDMGLLRQMAQRGEIPADAVPPRTLLFFDEMAAFLDPTKDEEVVVLQGEARKHITDIVLLGRAAEVNVIGAAQKPSNENIGTQIREMMDCKVGVGWMKRNMSEQVLGNERAEKLSRATTPKGRAWVVVSGEPDKLTQTYYLPTQQEVVAWADGQPTRPGAMDEVRRRLSALGYQQITVTNDAGGNEFRWAAPDLPVEPGQPSPQPAAANSP